MLFVACRTPGTLIALDRATGKEVGSIAAASGADDLFYDPALRRVYLISGAGEVDAYQVGPAGAALAGSFEDRSRRQDGAVCRAQICSMLVFPASRALAEIRVYTTVAP